MRCDPPDKSGSSDQYNPEENAGCPITHDRFPFALAFLSRTPSWQRQAQPTSPLYRHNIIHLSPLAVPFGGVRVPFSRYPRVPFSRRGHWLPSLSVGLPLSSCVARIESRSVTGVPAIRQAEYSSARQPARQPGRRQAVRRKNNMLGSCLGFADGLEIWLATGCATEAMTRRKFGRRNRSENACHRVTFRLSEAFPENIRPLA